MTLTQAQRTHTGESIPFERLDIIPCARTCAQAEEPRRTGR